MALLLETTIYSYKTFSQLNRNLTKISLSDILSGETLIKLPKSKSSLRMSWISGLCLGRLQDEGETTEL